MSNFWAKIQENGVLDFGSPYNTARWKDFCKINQGKYISLELPKPKRSIQQNSYYWLYLGVIERETGNDAEELHELFKVKFLPARSIVIKGKTHEHEVVVPRSTTSLSKVEFGEYMDKISAFTEIPLPNPKDLEKLGFILN